MTEKLIIKQYDEKQHELPETFLPVVKRVLSHRGITTKAQLDSALSQLVDPYIMKGMKGAVERLCDALERQQKIVIVGDFDADGATSSALCLIALERMGFQHVSFFVPNRFEYGYGLSEKIVEELAWQKPDLIITVDNGISSIQGVALANAKSIDVIITDHHLPGKKLPEAYSIINPNQHGCPFPHKNLAGVGVAFHLLIALRKSLRERSYFSLNAIDEPNLAELLDLVALGTVADVVPLDHYNRMLVSQGLARIKKGLARPGIRALLQVAGKSPQDLYSTDIGFAIAPRLNAAGRLDDMSHGVMLLTIDSDDLAQEMAQELDDLNKERREIQGVMEKEAEIILSELVEDEPGNGLCLYSEDWHEGIVGLLASRMKERCHKPVIAFAPSGDVLKGSARSIPGIHIRDILDLVATREPGLIDKFGGHAMAAGLSLQPDKYPQFQQAFQEALADVPEEVFAHVIYTDGELEADDLNLYAAQQLRDVLPWGQLMPEPLFTGSFYIKSVRVLKGAHMKFVLSLDESGAAEYDAIAFFCEAEWLDNFASLQGARLSMSYRLGINVFRGERTLQLMIQNLLAWE